MTFSDDLMNQRKLMWRLSNLLSIVFLLIIIFTWFQVDTNYKPNIDQLISSKAAKTDVLEKLNNSDTKSDQLFRYIPTGVFIQSLSFSSSNDVNITGYLWQKFLTSDSSKSAVSPSFVFPEQVGGNEAKLAYEHVREDHTIYGWYFDVTLRQKFNYLDYPLDHKTVWIRISPSYFDRNTILLPALDDYQSTNIGETFGLEKDLVLGNWEINESFFDYKMVSYDTNFGTEFKEQHYEYPELYFNVVVKRKFLNSFVINLVPLLTVAILLFALLMTVTGEPKKRDALGFNFTGVISIVSALFFVVMISHIQLRQQFSEDGIVYIEYFFLLMYFLMIMLIINTYIFSRGKMASAPFIMNNDNLQPKLYFWPFTLGVMAIVTLLKFVF